MISTMPISAPHPCSTPGCPALVPRGRARCDTHARQAEAARGTAAERGYDARWRRARKLFLALNPLCRPCGAAGRITAATVVDHIRDHKGDQALFWDEANWQPSCEACHNRRVDAGDFGRST